jgi:hypothetical protein
VKLVERLNDFSTDVCSLDEWGPVTEHVVDAVTCFFFVSVRMSFKGFEGKTVFCSDSCFREAGFVELNREISPTSGLIT